MENTDKRLFLLDAMALIFRAYYALISSPRITTKGRNTNAQFGFTNALLDLINNQKPTHMAVCFDTEAPTERHADFTDYKANRQEAPEDLLSALPDIKAIVLPDRLQAVGMGVFDSTGYRQDGTSYDRPGRATVVFVRPSVDASWLAQHTHLSLFRDVPTRSFKNKAEKR